MTCSSKEPYHLKSMHHIPITQESLALLTVILMSIPD